MTDKNSTVAIFNSHTEAEAAIKELQRYHFDLQKLSIVGRDYHTDENVVSGAKTRRCVYRPGTLRAWTTNRPPFFWSYPKGNSLVGREMISSRQPINDWNSKKL